VIWFYPYRFVLQQQTTDAVQLVTEIGELSPKDEIEYRIKANHIRLWVRLQFWRNSWNPIFDGRLEQVGSQSELRGYFRPNWLVLAFTVLFIGSTVYSLIEAIQSPAIRAGFEPAWKEKAVHFQTDFLAMAVLIVILGWAVGLFAQFKLLRLFQAFARRT
jgi:hypothetical protein